MCLVRHISNNSTQEAMEESHVQSFGRACMETLSCRNKACSYSPTVYIYSKCHALLYKLLYRHTKLQHLLTLRILYYCTFSSLNLLETTAFVYSEKRETEGLKNSIKMTLPKDNSLLWQLRHSRTQAAGASRKTVYSTGQGSLLVFPCFGPQSSKTHVRRHLSGLCSSHQGIHQLTFLLGCAGAARSCRPETGQRYTPLGCGFQ